MCAKLGQSVRDNVLLLSSQCLSTNDTRGMKMGFIRHVSVISHCSQHHKQPRSEVLCGSYRWVNFPGRNGVPKETSGAPSRLHRVTTPACPSITAVFVGAQVDHTNTKKGKILKNNSQLTQPSNTEGNGAPENPCTAQVVRKSQPAQTA